jgi:TonB family protein
MDGANWMRWKQLWIPALAAGWLMAEEPILRVSEADGKKAAIAKPAPEYPLVARQLKVSGKVNLEVVVGEDGVVTEVKILSGNPILTKPAAEALKKWRFHPFLQAGKAAAAVVNLSFEFDTH